MRLLIIGGTSFVGRAIALAASENGHDVSVINRGVTPSDLPSSVTALVGDRRGDLSALAGLSFDATADVVAYRPSDVDVLHGALGERGGRHLQISSISAYVDPTAEGATEANISLLADPEDLDAPITGETYGPLKAAAERRATELFGTDATFVRPTYVVGSHDVSLRFPYWVARLRRGGDVAVPGPRGNAMQWIDARDLASFTLGLLEQGVTGAFHAAGPFPAPRFAECLERVAERVAPAGTRLLDVPASMVIEAGLEAKFPLWSGPKNEPASAVNPAKALAAGLTLRPLEETVDDVAGWWPEADWSDRWLSASEEAALLASS
jgi:2'-hydroxyisoflavone reductase